MKQQREMWDFEYTYTPEKWKLERTNIPVLLKGKRVLEIGVGNGKNLYGILRQKPKLVHAIDFSKIAVDICKLKFKNKNLIIENKDICNTEFKDESFDVVLCYYVLNNLNEKQRNVAIKEMKRLLVKGGILSFEDFMQGDIRQENKVEKEIEKNTLLKNNGLVCHFFTKKEVKDIFKEFRKIRVETKEFSLIKRRPELTRKLIYAEIIK